MTKRDVTIWFCKIWALSGIINFVFSSMGYLMSWMASSGFGGRFYPLSSLAYSVPHLALASFLWLFATSIGTELAAEGDYGSAITSASELRPLLPRCVGLMMLLTATSPLALTLFQIGSFYFSASTPGSATFIRSFVGSAIGFALQSIIGFSLAFTPRIRVFLRK